ncbi:putative trans-sialidase, Group VI [Trypanosoma cruzi]|uniref:Trans-sialidase, putative n=2 Tax=Trypanosoma cruzi TaxID=5693 RepID=Q4DK48_TRYCC|nr:trans-sialidase, putative [Trypanosoma cruzi]EAN92904.1 trans-sialidase, putative [Trypanosoma cruzi]PWV14111.1 putative trans-sialidase, Group VI [Trypanosoma cruzi]RNC34318.1 putative trans-sialidase [Trypanosoma cruzi]|eukprot:XP_814755.1 trans-sialidase [Trypanosoma cruzi strain CL Brener]
MLSRVAAVKAPRTHNRRRVTGSSGRRREGRESERQRPNMSRRVFASAVLLLLLVMIFCGTGATQGDVEEPSAVPKYQWKGISEGDVTVESLGAPGLLKVGSDVFAVSEAQCKKKDGEDALTGVASQLLTIEGDKEPEEVLKDARVIRVLEESTSAKETKRVDVSRPTAVVGESNIYMLVGKYSRKGGQESGADDWGFLMVKGEFSDKDESKKQIDWKDTNAVPTTTLGEQLSSLTGLIGGGGSGVKMEDGTLVFPVEGTKEEVGQKEAAGGKTFSLLMYTLDTLKKIESWKLSKGMSADGCSDPSVVEWEKDKLMMMTACGDGRRRVYESGDKGESWTEALGTLSRVWGNKQEGEGKGVGSGFTTATFGTGGDEKNVMLVTLPVYAKGKEKGVLHLWLTDNTHIVDIGPVSGKDDDAAASSLLYKSVTSGTDDNKREELIALYEKKGDGESSNSLWSVRLTEQLQRVKDVLATWKKVDERVSQLCHYKSALEDTPTDTACKNTKITDGLVGFLSGNFSDDTWKDEYLGVNATVKKGTKGAAAGVAETAESSDGVKFTGRGAWAEWPVGKQGENQLYRFANYNFTLVATVSIDGVPKQEGPIPVIGVMMDAENPVLLGLSYNNKEKKWQMLCGEKPTEVQNHIEGQEKTHQVAIVLQNGTQGSAYVDGRRVLENVQCQLESEEDKKISHFYIGGDGVNAENTEGHEGVSVTVTNVLLYNRPLDGNGITALNAIKALITPPKEKSAQEIVVPSPGGTPQAGQEPLNGGKGADGGSASPSASIASPSIPVGQSVNQLAPGKPPDGNADVDVFSSSSGNLAVGEGSADTTQGDGPHTPSVGDTPAAADTNVLTAKGEGHDGPALTADVSVSSGADGETAGGTDGQEGIHPQNGEVKSAALSSSLGNLSQGNNSDAGAVRERRALPLLLLLGLWGVATV